MQEEDTMSDTTVVDGQCQVCDLEESHHVMWLLTERCPEFEALTDRDAGFETIRHVHLCDRHIHVHLCDRCLDERWPLAGMTFAGRYCYATPAVARVFDHEHAES
jgi:hypothetical protein